MLKHHHQNDFKAWAMIITVYINHVQENPCFSLACVAVTMITGINNDKLKMLKTPNSRFWSSLLYITYTEDQRSSWLKLREVQCDNYDTSFLLQMMSWWWTRRCFLRLNWGTLWRSHTPMMNTGERETTCPSDHQCLCFWCCWMWCCWSLWADFISG